MTSKTKTWLSSDFTRRTFLRTSAVAGSAAVAGMTLMKRSNAHVIEDLHYDAEPDPVTGVSYVYTTCLMCHSDCGMKVRVSNGVAVKIEGNPYHPQNLEPDEQTPMTTDPATQDLVNGRLCSKGQAALETLYNPYRVKTPLRRTGPRGAGMWESITWDEALNEIAAAMSAVHSQTAMINSYGDDMGPLANKVGFSRGRLEHGPSEYVKRWMNTSFGTINSDLGHTSICETTRHVVTEQSLSGKNHLKPDVANCQYLIVFGSSPLEASFAMQSYARKIMRAINDNGMELVVVDPRFSNSAAKGQWVPVKPGTDGALAMGMIHWIIENAAYDSDFLRYCNKTDAQLAGESSWTDATNLVRSDNGELLTKDDLDGSGDTDIMVWDSGGPVSSDSVAQADLLVDAETVTLDAGGDIEVSSVLQLLANRANEHSRQWYADQCELPLATIEGMAQGFTSHGKLAAADYYRGPSQHTNGWNSCQAILNLNMLIGNIDWKGGYGPGGSHLHETDGGGLGVDVMDVAGAPGKSGLKIERSGANYTDTNEFAVEGFPAKRPWFPLASHGNFQELLPSMAAAYPYQMEVFITYCNDTLFTTPAHRMTGSQALGDETKIPLFIAIDIDMNETTAFADIVLPDTTFLERWGTPHASPTTMLKASPWRQPVVGTINKVDPNQDGLLPYLPQTRQLVDMLIDLGNRINGFPGLGANAFPNGDPLYNSWDWYAKMLDNIVVEGNDKYNTSYTAADIENRGGFFEMPTDEYDGDMLAHKLGKKASFYATGVVGIQNSMTGEYFDPLAKFERPKDIMGNDIEMMDSGFPFQLITYKPAFHTQSRTALDPSLMMLMPENFCEMNASDGTVLGLETGDQVRVIGTNGDSIEGAVKLTQGMKPGVVAISASYGHWAMSSKPYVVDGVVQPYDKTRGAGLHSCSVMRLDGNLGDVCLQEPIGGSASFYDSRVRIEKV